MRINTMRRRVNEETVKLIKEFEGLRLTAYRCPAGVWTIGYGSTNGVTPDMKVTAHEAEELLLRDLGKFERGVEKLLKRHATDGQFGAFVSLAFNIGLGAFGKSTALRRFNAGDLAGAAEALTWFNKATVGKAKVKLAGLVRRREAERALFWSDASVDVEVLDLEPTGKIEGGEAKPLSQSKTIIATLAGAALWALENFGGYWSVIPEEVKAAAPWLMAAVFAALLVNRVAEARRGEH